MMRHGLTGWAIAAVVLAGVASAQPAPDPVQPSPHGSDWPNLGTGQTPGMVAASLALGPEMTRSQLARDMLAERRKLDRALAALATQRKGVVDVYVVSAALDSDPVFSREAREAGKVLTRRYGAAGRSVSLAGPDGRVSNLPKGSLTALTVTLARIAEVMDPAEDVLVLYTTSHGAPEGLAYHDGDSGFGIMSPYRLGGILSELGIKRRVVLLSACFSGVFVPYLASPDTAIITAASAERTSFGCLADNDWTFFGDAMINHALRKPRPLGEAADEARQEIARWERSAGLPSSDPQVSLGENVAHWLPAIEARMPQGATAPVGVPAITSLAKLTPAKGALVGPPQEPPPRTRGVH